MMFLRKAVAASAVIAVLATVSSAGTASAATADTLPTAVMSTPLADWLYATCPPWYGFRNPAVGCSSWADYFYYTSLSQLGHG